MAEQQSEQGIPRHSFPVLVHVVLSQAPDRVFLLRRAGTGYRDGWYTLPGGHVEAGETLTAAAHRECREEAGVVATSLMPVAVLSYLDRREQPPVQGYNFIFLAREFTGNPGIAESENFDACGFFPPGGCPETTIDWVREVLKMTDGPLPALNLREFQWD